MMTTRNPHEVSAPSLPDDSRRILPLIGNDTVKLCVDARGAMHDFEALPSYPPPRIIMTGRRHNIRIDRYSSNLFEWGFLDLKLKGEGLLPKVTGWKQRLCPRQGLVETEILRGSVEERNASFVHLEKNLIVFHREYRNLPKSRRWTMQADYCFCQAETKKIPFRTTFGPFLKDSFGVEAAATADGIVMYSGRIALFASRSCKASWKANHLLLDVPLSDEGSATVYLSLLDDLGNEPQLVHIPDGAWMSPSVREVNKENLKLRVFRPDPKTETRKLRSWVGREGYAGVRRKHEKAWKNFWDGIRISIPPEETALKAAFETQVYTIRCSFTDWSLPANPFNSSWGAGYFWDERYGMEGLMACGAMEMPERILEFRRRTLPFSTMMTAGRGSRYPSCVVESGQMISDRNGTHFYEFPHIGVIANYVRIFTKYRDDLETLRRYYPIVRECAEYFRNWMLVELPGNNIMVVPLIDIDEGRYPVQDGPAMLTGAARTMHLASEMSETLGLAGPEAFEWKRLADMATSLSRRLDPGNVVDGGPLTVHPLCHSDFEIDYLPESRLKADERIARWRDEYRRRHAPKGVEENVSGEKGTLPEWSWGYLSNAHFYASRMMPEEALANLRGSLKTVMDFSALNESAQAGLGLIHHPWFTTAAGSFLRALARMLLYPKKGEMILMPGIPGEWSDFSFTLPAYGGVWVQAQVRSGKISRLKLTSKKKGKTHCTVQVPVRFLPEEERIKMRGDAKTLAVNVVFSGTAEIY